MFTVNAALQLGSSPSTVRPNDTGLAVSIHEIDTSFQQHLAAGYWAWRDLVERDPNSRVEQHPDFVLTELSFAERCDARPAFLVVVEQSSRAIAAAVLVPKSLGGEKRFGPAWNLRGYRLVGNQTIGADSEDVIGLLLDATRDVLITTRADFLMVEDLDEQSALRRSLSSATCGLRVFQTVPNQIHHRIEFPPVAEDYWQKFSSKTRNTLRRKSKQFEDGRLERITQPDQVVDYLAQAHEISKHSWQTELLGLRVRNDEAELQLLTMLASQGTLRAYLLWKGDTAVSFCFGTQHNGVFMYEEVAYDRRWADSSPGQVMVIRMLEDLLAHNSPRVFDFGFGDAEYKRQFGNVVGLSGPLWLLRPGLRSALVVGYMHGRRLLVRGLRGLLVKTGLLQRVKQWVKGTRGKRG